MTSSMTAYAREQTDASWGTAAWELRSVNHRYLDASFRMPDDWRALEHPLRERLAKRIRRGKVECTLRLRVDAGHSGELTLNTDLAKKVIRAGDTLSALMTDPSSSPMSVNDVLRWPGVIEAEQLDTDTVGKHLSDLFDAALEEFVSARRREGGNLGELIRGRCDEIADVVEIVRPRMPDIITAHRERTLSRIAELGSDLDPGRLEQEIVLFAQKVDVSEEMDRLLTHVDEVRRVLDQTKPIGRRLDFLMQELNREANTLGSKSVDNVTTNASVDLKVLIEQMREQIQNLE